ncbi:MAG: TolC family protein [Wolbachia endosymbiont of Menacanthus eurysternus]|nr:MAG: TolC family protein [Wolbachia endosymbiont of Menacanthus eurysternus]
MFQLIVILVITFLSVSCCCAVNLEEIINKAIKNSLKLKYQFHQYKNTKTQLKLTNLTNFLPEINLKLNLDENFNSNKIITLNQKIIDWGNTLATFNKSNHLLNIEKIRFQQLKQEVALNAVKTYVDVLYKIEILKLKKHKEYVSLENLLAIKKRSSLGEITSTEVSLAKARFLSAISERIDAEGKLKLANISYFHLIGEIPNKLPKINNKLPSIPNLNECIKLAKTNNLSLKALIYQKKAAKMEMVTKLSKLLPSLNLNISTNLKSGNTQSGNQLLPKKLLGNFNIIFTFNIPILKIGINTIDINQAKINIKKSTYDYYQITKNIEKEIINSWNNILTAKAVIKANYETEKAIISSLKRIKQEINLGLKNTIELLNIKEKLFKTRLNLIEAKGNYIINVYNLLFTINSNSTTSNK